MGDDIEVLEMDIVTVFITWWLYELFVNFLRLVLTIESMNSSDSNWYILQSWSILIVLFQFFHFY